MSKRVCDECFKCYETNQPIVEILEIPFPFTFWTEGNSLTVKDVLLIPKEEEERREMSLSELQLIKKVNSKRYALELFFSELPRVARSKMFLFKFRARKLWKRLNEYFTKP